MALFKTGSTEWKTVLEVGGQIRFWTGHIVFERKSPRKAFFFFF